jgi:hypothetical protein
MEVRASKGRYRIVERRAEGELELRVLGPGLPRDGMKIDAELDTLLDLLQATYIAGKKARSREIRDLLSERTNDGVAT